MKETMIRGMHRRTGVLLALFIFIQVASGTALSVFHLAEGGKPEAAASRDAAQGERVIAGTAHHDESELEEVLEFLHKRGGAPGDIYRIVQGAGLMFMIFTGFLINRAVMKRGKGA